MAGGETVPQEKGPALPGNHGQFGEDAATERFEPLEKGGERPAPQGPKQTGAGERS